MSTVTFNGTRLNDADSNTGWGNKNGGGPSPGSEPQLKYQGTGAVNRKVTATTARQGVEYNHGSTTDMTSASFPLIFAKVKVADAGDLNTVYGCEYDIGSGSGAYYSYNLSGSGANNDQYTAGYNSQGGLAEGYIITSINPNVAQWREGTTGSPVLTAVDYFAFAAQFVAGGAKSENVACDSLDIGVGLDYTGASFTFQDAVDTDQGNTSNRWGCACQNGSVISLRGFHDIGAGGVVTSGVDQSDILFPDGYHGSSDCGFSLDCTNASHGYELSGSYKGLGRVYGADDTRPVLNSIGTASTIPLTGSFDTWSELNLTSSIVLSGSVKNSGPVDQNGADLTNASIEDSTGSFAVVIDDLTKTDGLTVINSGVDGIDLTGETATEITIDNITATGAIGDDVVVNNALDVTLNLINGADVATVRNIGAGNASISNPKSLILTGLDSNSKVYLFDTAFTESSPNYQLDSQLIVSGDYEYLFQGGANIDALVRIVNLQKQIREFDINLNTENISIPIQLQLDRVYANN